MPSSLRAHICGRPILRKERTNFYRLSDGHGMFTSTYIHAYIHPYQTHSKEIKMQSKGKQIKPAIKQKNKQAHE